jgi:hypothetical protein
MLQRMAAPVPKVLISATQSKTMQQPFFAHGVVA